MIGELALKSKFSEFPKQAHRLLGAISLQGIGPALYLNYVFDLSFQCTEGGQRT
jgi:hypothetical protein